MRMRFTNELFRFFLRFTFKKFFAERKRSKKVEKSISYLIRSRCTLLCLLSSIEFAEIHQNWPNILQKSQIWRILGEFWQIKFYPIGPAVQIIQQEE